MLRKRWMMCSRMVVCRKRCMCSSSSSSSSSSSFSSPSAVSSLMKPTFEKLSIAKPHEWFTARNMKRRVILHVGPTNSGKTYEALQRLKKSTSAGIFCAPLRLLAWQVSNELGCSLVTGQEKSVVPTSKVVACTVEMCDISTVYDVAVVDEIQLMGDPERGASFTRAVLGLQAHELHLCGEPRVVDLVTKLCAMTGDDLQVERYQRLSPLKAAQQAVGSIENVRQGDCVVVFSREGVHRVRRLIETLTPHRCAVVYGNLPPETRKAQAWDFNKRHKSVLVSTDAVGMGLNLSIDRVVFHEVTKFDGTEHRRLTAHEILQIAGRAGRFGISKSGLAAAFKDDHHLAVQEAFDTQAVGGLASLKKAVVYPPREFIRARFHNVLVDMMQDNIRDLVKEAGQKNKKYPSHVVATKWLARAIHTAYIGVLKEVDAIRLLQHNVGSSNNVFQLADAEEPFERLACIENMCLGVTDLQALADAPFSLRSANQRRAFKRYTKQLEKNAYGLLHDAFSDPFYIQLYGPVFQRFGCKPMTKTNQQEELGRAKKLPLVKGKVKGVRTSNGLKSAGEDIERLEDLHGVLDLCLWLGKRYEHTEEEMVHVQRKRKLVGVEIENGLKQVSQIKKRDKRMRKSKFR